MDPWTMLLYSKLLSSSKTCLKIETWRRQEKTQKISDPSMAGRGEEEAVYARLAQRRPTLMRIGAESGAKDREAGYQCYLK